MAALPHKMRAMVLTGHGGLEKLVYHEDWPAPQITSPMDALIKVHACGLNNTDINTRTAWYSKKVTDATTGGALDDADGDDASWGGAPLTFPRIQGADVCGTVIAVGAEADQALVGKRVLLDTWLRNWDDPYNMNAIGYYGSEIDGGYAEYTKTDSRYVHPVDSALSHTELATFATSSSTAEGMLDRAEVGDTDTILITGASGGVGTALINLAKRRGARTIAITSSAKMAGVKAYTPDKIIDRTAPLKQALDGEKVTVVADVVGGASFPAVLECLERGGRLVCSGAIAGPIVDLDLRTMYLMDLTLLGSTILPPGTFGNLVRYINDNEIPPMLAETFSLERLHDAQRTFIAKEHVGNIVLDMDA